MYVASHSQLRLLAASWWCYALDDDDVTMVQRRQSIASAEISEEVSSALTSLSECISLYYLKKTGNCFFLHLWAKNANIVTQTASDNFIIFCLSNRISSRKCQHWQNARADLDQTAKGNNHINIISQTVQCPFTKSSTTWYTKRTNVSVA